MHVRKVFDDKLVLNDPTNEHQAIRETKLIRL